MVTLAVINCDFVENPILNFEIISVEKTLVSIFTSILTATTFTLHIRSPQSSKKAHYHVTFCLTVGSSSAWWNNVIAIGIEVITSRPHDTNIIYRQYHHIKSPCLAYLIGSVADPRFSPIMQAEIIICQISLNGIHLFNGGEHNTAWWQLKWALMQLSRAHKMSRDNRKQ